MRNQSQESRYNLKKNVCMGLSLFIFIVIAAGCATPTPPPQEQGQYIKIQAGQNSISVPWSNNKTQVTNQVTMQQIVDWTKQNVSSDEIISRIKAANPKYSLTVDDLGYLKRQGVSQRVIEIMQVYN